MSVRLGIGFISIVLSFFVFVFVIIAFIGGTIFLGQLPADQFCPPLEGTDYILFNGITYSALDERSTIINIGTEFDVVKRSLLERSCEDAGYGSQDGEASFLKKGTQVYTVEGYAPYFRLAIRKDNEARLYQVTSNSQARRGSDLFDIRARVSNIEIYRADLTGHEKHRKLTTISESSRVTLLVNSLLDASLVSKPRAVSNDERTYSLVFRLDDGTSLSLFYWPKLNKLQYNLTPSDEFKNIIREALEFR